MYLFYFSQSSGRKKKKHACEKDLKASQILFSWTKINKQLTARSRSECSNSLFLWMTTFMRDHAPLPHRPTSLGSTVFWRSQPTSSPFVPELDGLWLRACDPIGWGKYGGGRGRLEWGRSQYKSWSLRRERDQIFKGWSSVRGMCRLSDLTPVDKGRFCFSVLEDGWITGFGLISAHFSSMWTSWQYGDAVVVCCLASGDG